jgi:hypothetical protein
MKKTLIFGALLICLTPLWRAHAVMQVIYPDEQRLRPAPANIAPNFGHTTNSSNTVAPDTHVQTPDENMHPDTSSQAPAPEEKSHTLWWILGSIAVIGGGIYTMRKK